MGCGGSKASTRVHDQRPPPTRELKQANTDDKPETSKQQGPLTEEHIAVVQNTWKYVKSDLQEVGIIFYTRLFQQEPQLLELFSFKDISTADNVQSDDRARRQALVTMQHVDLAVSSLSDLASVVPALKELGGRHAMMYHVTDEHYGPVGAALLYTLESGLGEKFTSEAKEAWTTVYGIVSGTMKAGAKEILDAQ